jgi:hypothetical protein
MSIFICNQQNSRMDAGSGNARKGFILALSHPCVFMFYEVMSWQF